MYADLYGIETIGLRYFNIFGPKQNPQGPYAAVIPIFAMSLLERKSPVINGDGSHSRDFTFVDNAVEANTLSLFTNKKEAVNQVYNIACGKRTSIIELFELLAGFASSEIKPSFGPERIGDVKNSLADISKAERLLGYTPAVSVEEGLKKTFEWYKSRKKISV